MNPAGGKSVLVNSLMGLLPYGKTKIKADTFMIDGSDCLEFTEDDWNELRGTTVAMVFQDPMTSLNPIMTIGSNCMRLSIVLMHMVRIMTNELSPSTC